MAQQSLMTPRRSSWADRTYITAVCAPLVTAFGNIFKRSHTEGYPEKSGVRPGRYRGMPRLTVDDEGRTRCVACFLCETVCPAECIRIEAAESPEESVMEARDRDAAQQCREREKSRWPAQFELDMGRCVFCGLCAEACPEEAIVMSQRRHLVAEDRDELVFDRESLLPSGT